ncbi:MAG: hypothetical protein HYW85_02040 [Deltaproteobacteria bacterium]|nr:hypothetical protein [Deltaproteobacteria bacterium]
MITLKSLIKISHEQLLKDFSGVVLREREVISEVVAFIAEIRKRKLYAEAGYSSLFPEVLEHLSHGSLTLISLSLIESHVTQENGKELIHQIFGKKKEEVEYLLSTLFSKEEPKTKDKIRRLPVIKKESQHFHSEGIKLGTLDFSQKEPEIFPTISQALSDTASSKVQEIRKVKIEFVADEKVARLIERAKELLRHKYPHGKLEDLVREAFELLLEKKDPTRKINRNEVVRKISQSATRHVPERVKREIWQRDHGQCTFVSQEGKSCESKEFLQLDHIRPWALGGLRRHLGKKRYRIIRQSHWNYCIILNNYEKMAMVWNGLGGAGNRCELCFQVSSV